MLSDLLTRLYDGDAGIVDDGQNPGASVQNRCASIKEPCKIMTTPVCIYCGKEDGSTKDHVPPKSFFPHNRPSNLITVPSCPSCNKGFATDEDLFLATFMFGDAGASEAGKALWDEKLHRMYEKNKGLRRRIAANLHPVDIRLPSGVYIREGMAIQLEHSRLRNVIEKIVRGLYHFEFPEMLPIDVEVISHFARSKEEMAPILPTNEELRNGSRKWKGIFEYRFNRVNERPDASVWIFRFYGCHVFWSVTNVSDEPSH